MPLLHPAPPWRPDISQFLVLWHGCTAIDAKAIAANGVQLSASRLALDFGRGFYTTTLERQARHWAWLRYYDPRSPKRNNQPAVIRFRVDRQKLAKLESLCFVRGSYDHDDYWSLVQHCRQSVEPRKSTLAVVNDHRGPVPDNGDWFDLVAGPAAASWKQRVAMADADQYSFHTRRAITVLNDLRKLTSTDFRWDPVIP